MKNVQTITIVLLIALFMSAGALATMHLDENASISAIHIGNNTYNLSCDTNMSAIEYMWDFGDGNQTNTSSPTTHTYMPGNYVISCTPITDEQNESTTNATINHSLIVSETETQPTNITQNNTANDTEQNLTNQTNQTAEQNITNQTNQSNQTTEQNITNETQPNQTNDSEVNETIPPVLPVQNETSLTLNAQKIAPGEYQFTCTGQGYSPRAYDWNFGDGTTAYDNPENTVTHRYSMPGVKTVYCGAWAPGVYESEIIRIEVTDIEPEATVVVLENNDPTFTFRCDVNSTQPDTYDWDFGDGTIYLDTLNASMTHTYNRTGGFDVSCGPWFQELQHHTTGYTRINVSNSDEGPSQDISILRERRAGSEYAFTCLTPGMNPIAYDWEVYDVYGTTFEIREHDVGHDNIEHTFDTDGKYVISCTATDEEHTIIAWEFLTITGATTQHNIVQEIPQQDLPPHVTHITVTENRATITLTEHTTSDLWLVLETDVEQVINLSALLNNNRATIPAALTVESTMDQGMLVHIPRNTTVTADGTWDGLFWLPHEGQAPENAPEDITRIVRVGADTSLTFDRAVRLLFVGQAGERVAIEHAGELTHINQTCEQDNQAYADTLEHATACAVSVDDDLVVWTKSFSQFITYEDEDETPELTVSQEERAMQQAQVERERRTMTTFDSSSAPPSSPIPSPNENETGSIETDNMWWWAILGAMVLGIILIASLFMGGSRKDNSRRRNT